MVSMDILSMLPSFHSNWINYFIGIQARSNPLLQKVLPSTMSEHLAHFLHFLQSPPDYAAEWPNEGLHGRYIGQRFLRVVVTALHIITVFFQAGQSSAERGTLV
jgi:hypothetical protein